MTAFEILVLISIAAAYVATGYAIWRCGLLAERVTRLEAKKRPRVKNVVAEAASSLAYPRPIRDRRCCRGVAQRAHELLDGRERCRFRIRVCRLHWCALRSRGQLRYDGT